MIVKEGIMSNPGTSSSTKASTPATFPAEPLYILVISQPATGAQIISVNSPNPGMRNEAIPTASKASPARSSMNLGLVPDIQVLFVDGNFSFMKGWN